MRKIFLSFLNFSTFLPAWNLGFLFYYFSLSYDYKIVNYLQTSASHRSPSVGQGQTEFPPCSGFGIQHCSGMPRRGQHSTSQRHWVPSPTGYSGSGDTDSTKHHQLSPDSVQIKFQTPVPWDLEAPTEPLFCFFSYFGCTGSLLRCAGLLQSVMRS